MVKRKKRKKLLMRKCTCGHIACVCNILRRHEKGCAFRRAATCPVPIECEHGNDCCDICDKCSCGAKVTAEDFRPLEREKKVA